MTASPGYVLGLDFGTACTCYALRKIGTADAVAFPLDGSGNPTLVKTPSDITFVYDSKFHCTLRQRVNDASRCYFTSDYPLDGDKSKFPNFVTFRGYKMALYPQSGQLHVEGDSEPTVKGSDDEQYPFPVILKVLFERIRTALRSAHHYKLITCVTITVPAIATTAAKDLMMDAATRGLGIPSTRVRMITEPDAALRSALFNSGTLAQGLLPVGQSIIIFDIGGGTSDFVLAKMIRDKPPLEIEYPITPFGGAAGGWNVDENLFSFMQQLLVPGQPHILPKTTVRAAIISEFLPQKHSASTNYTVTFPVDKLMDSCTSFRDDFPDGGEVAFLNYLLANLDTQAQHYAECSLPPAAGEPSPAGLFYLSFDDNPEKPITKGDITGDANLEEIHLILTDAFVRGFFYLPVVEEIVGLAKTFVAKARKADPSCNRIQLAGGFIGCRLVREALTSMFCAATGNDDGMGGFRVVVTPKPSIAVAGGACLETPPDVIYLGPYVPLGASTSYLSESLRPNASSSHPRSLSAGQPANDEPSSQKGSLGFSVKITQLSHQQPVSEVSPRLSPTSDSYHASPTIPSSGGSTISSRTPSPAHTRSSSVYHSEESTDTLTNSDVDTNTDNVTDTDADTDTDTNTDTDTDTEIPIDHHPEPDSELEYDSHPPVDTSHLLPESEDSQPDDIPDDTVRKIVTVFKLSELYAFELPMSYVSLYNNRELRKRLSEVFSFYSDAGVRIAYNTVCPIFEREEKVYNNGTSRVFTGLRPFDDRQRQIEIVVHTYNATMEEDPLVASPRPYARFIIPITDADMAVPYGDRTFDITFSAANGLTMMYAGPAARSKRGLQGAMQEARRETTNLLTQRQLKLREMQQAQGQDRVGLMLSADPQHTYMVIDYSGSMGVPADTGLTYPQTRPNYAAGGPPTVFATVMEWVADYLTLRRDISRDPKKERFTLLLFTTEAYDDDTLSTKLCYSDAGLPTAEEFLERELVVRADRCFEENFAETLVYLAEKVSMAISEPSLEHSVYFLSDGESRLKDKKRVSEALENGGFSSFVTIGFGRHNATTLREIAAVGKGQYVAAKDAAGLRKIFGFGV